MGGGNAQKTAMKRAKAQEQASKAGAGSQLKQNNAAMTKKCNVCLATFVCTTTEAKLKEHWENKHPKSELSACFPDM